MIAGSRMIAVAALVLSTLAHGAGVAGFWTEKTVQQEGGAPATTARLGNSFQDVAQGTQTPEKVVESQEPKSPQDRVKAQEYANQQSAVSAKERRIPDSPEREQAAEKTSARQEPLSQTYVQFPEPTTQLQSAGSVETVQAVRAPASAPAQSADQQSEPQVQASPNQSLTVTVPAAPVLVTSTATPTVQITQAPIEVQETLQEALQPKKTASMASAIVSDTSSSSISAVPQASQQKLSSVIPLQPVEAMAAPRQPKLQSVIAALPNEDDAVAPVLSSRPKKRPKAIEEAARQQQPKPQLRKTTSIPKAKPKAEPKKQASRQGVNQPDQVQGSTDGQQKAKASQSSSKGKQAKRAGNAAASNYPGLVMRKISRQRRPRVNARGSATIGFRVAGNGGLANARVTKSSGNAQLDAAALQLVRRAAPFSPPPAGAQRTFAISIKGR